MFEVTYQTVNTLIDCCFVSYIQHMYGNTLVWRLSSFPFLSVFDWFLPNFTDQTQRCTFYDVFFFFGRGWKKDFNQPYFRVSFFSPTKYHTDLILGFGWWKTTKKMKRNENGTCGWFLSIQMAMVCVLCCAVYVYQQHWIAKSPCVSFYRFDSM